MDLPVENMKWATNHAIQDEYSYQVDGSTFETMIRRVTVTVSIYDAFTTKFQYPSFKSLAIS